MKQRFSKRTRLVSALLTLAMVFTFLPFSAFAATGNVAINSTNFPDAKFLEIVKTYDKDSNDSLSLSERDSVQEIVCNDQGIESLKGIEHFSRLQQLKCYNNNLTTLDLRKNTQLIKLQCDKNQLMSLDLGVNTKLNLLSCRNNKLKSLDVSGIDVQYFYCSNNQLTSLNLTNHTSLKDVDCSNNKLTTLEIGTKNYLMRINCQQNKLASLDVNNVPDLQYLYCDSNQLTKLVVSNNPELEELECQSNQLTSLDVSKNTKLKRLQCYNNHLTSLDISSCASGIDFNGGSNTYSITFDENMKFDLNTLPGHFDVTKSSNWENGNVVGTTLKPNGGNPGAVGYSYDCGKGKTVHFHLNVSYTHTHAYDGTWKRDESKHWHECTNSACPDKPGSVTDSAAHVYYNDADTTCKICGYVRTVHTHTYDSNGTCTTCGYKKPSSGGSSGGGSSSGGSTGGGTVTPPEAGKYQLTVTDGVATVNGKTGYVLNVKPGDTVTLTADTTKFPENEEFGWWEITPYGSVSNTLTGQYQRTATFTMPNENVSARAMSKSAGVSTGGDDGSGGGGAAILLVGGAAVAGLVGYGVYSYVSEQQLKALLPEGVAMPENRAQTALLLWNTAGRPEPAEAPAFKDVADPDTAKAAQWCVEHGLMDQKLGGRFAPDNSDPAYKTLNAYQQLVG